MVNFMFCLLFTDWWNSCKLFWIYGIFDWHLLKATWAGLCNTECSAGTVHGLWMHYVVCLFAPTYLFFLKRGWSCIFVCMMWIYCLVCLFPFLTIHHLGHLVWACHLEIVAPVVCTCCLFSFSVLGYGSASYGYVSMSIKSMRSLSVLPLCCKCFSLIILRLELFPLNPWWIFFGFWNT